MRRQPRNVHFEFTMRHGPVSGPIIGSLAALALTVVIWSTRQFGDGWPVWLPLALAAGGSAVAGVVAYARASSIGNLVYRIACWVGGGAWSFICLTWVDDFLAFLLAVVILGALAGFAGMLLQLFRPSQQLEVFDGVIDGEVVDEAGLVPARNPDDVAYWLELLTAKLLNLSDETVKFTRVKDWPNDSGATFLVEFSIGSSRGLSDIREIQVALQQSLRLPDGCTVAAKRSGTQGTVLVDVMFYNDMETVAWYPSEYVKRSGKDDFSIGLHGDKTCALTNLYQTSMAIAGRRGEGKTVIEHSITASMAQCRDVIIWHVDLNGGSLSAPWCYLTANGQMQGHIVDWVAHNSRTALQMAKAAVKIAKFRKAYYQSLLMRMNTQKLPISPDLPEILIIVDEGGEVFGEETDKDAQEAAKLFREVQRIGRAMCVNIIFSVQRATADFLTSQMKKNAATKISVRVDDDAELAYMFDWNKLSSDDLLYPGCAFMKTGHDGAAQIRMIKMYLIENDQILEVCRATVGWRPQLDKPSADHVADLYYDRWEEPDTAAWMANLRGDSAAYSQMQAETSVALLDRPASGLSGLTAKIQELNAGLDAVDEARKKTPPPAGGGGIPPIPPAPEPPATGGGGSGGGRHLDPREVVKHMDPMKLNGMLAELAAGLEQVDADATDRSGPEQQTTAGGQPEPGKADPLEWAYGFIDGFGPEGVKTEQIVAAAIEAGLTRRRQTINDWLVKLRTANRVFPRTGEDPNKTKDGYYVSDRHAA